MAGATRHLALHDAVNQSRLSLVPFEERRDRRSCRPASVPMITAIVFVKADVARIPEVAEAIAAIEGISEVYSVTGQIDLIALVRVRNHETSRRSSPTGSTRCRRGLDETHIAFRAYSRHDLESAFSLGLD